MSTRATVLCLLGLLGLFLPPDCAAQQTDRDTTTVAGGDTGAPADTNAPADTTSAAPAAPSSGGHSAAQEAGAQTSGAQTSGAQASGAQASGAQLVVGVSSAPPFAIKGENGSWQGIAVHLWRAVADSLNLTYEWRELSTEDQVARVADGTVDLALTTAATADAEQRVDFAPVYYAATIGVAGSRRRSIMGMVSAFFSARFFWIVAGLAVLLLVMGTLMWLIERNSNDDHFGGERGLAHGIGSGFWWAGVTMTTIGYGDKTPMTFWGRVLAMLWMLIAMVVTAILTASLVSIVGDSGAGSALTAPGQLRSMTVGTEDGSPGAAFLKENGVSYRSFNAPSKGLRALKSDSIDAFVYSTPVLEHLTSRRRDLRTTVQSTGRPSQRYAFALPEGSPRAETLRRVVLAHIDTGAWYDLVQRYLSQGSGKK